MPKENESFHSAWPSRILSYLKIVKESAMPKENESFHSAWPSRILSYLKIVKGECNAKGKRKFSFGIAEPHPNLRKSIRILNTPLTQHEFKPFLKNNESFSLQYLSFQLPLPSKCYLQAECPTANTNRLANSLIALFSVSV